MISIIICSRKTDISKELKDNIASTIGCKYELCVIDNSRNDYNIFTAYNEGVRRAKRDILCFMHEDVLFHTAGWGKTILEQFNDESIGIIGFTGAHFLPKAPLYWFSSPFISQYNLQTGDSETLENDTTDYFHGVLADVAVIDGFCFFVRSTLFDYINFDEKNYQGFHAYDMDICMQVQKLNKRVCVSRAILVEHKWSERLLHNEKYMQLLYDNMCIFYDKWKEYLPITRGIDEPEYILYRLNNLCIQAYDAQVARRSKAYRLGRALLTPINAVKKLFSR